MISVLIPVFNFDLNRLVADLHDQLSDNQISFEIIVCDDGSTEHFIALNRKACQGLPHVYFIALGSNHGRSVIRNMMATRAYYDYLLFLDCDAVVHSPHFIRNYLQALPFEGVLVGGVAYSPQIPDDIHFLRWKYGQKREVRTVDSRNKTPFLSFSGFNFLIPKNLFMQIRFNEQISHYGHEDTLLGFELFDKNIEIRHIDNSLIHSGLETNEGFLLKTLSALGNLKWMIHSEIVHRKHLQSNKLYQTYIILKKIRLLWLVEFIFAQWQHSMTRNLNSTRARMWVFDCWKLLHFIRIMKD